MLKKIVKYSGLSMAALMVFSLNAQADITIAVVGPMTGPHAPFGEQEKRGAIMAVEDLNAKGGVLGEKVILEIADDQCDPKQAVAVANQLVGKQVKFVAGHFCSSSSIPASEIYAEEHIVMMTPGSTQTTLTDRGLDNVFRFVGRDDQQGLVAAQFIKKEFPKSKIAIVHDKQSYSKGLADETKKRLNDAGVTEALYETINPHEADYNALIAKLKSENIDVLYYGGYHTEAGLIVRQMREQGVNTVMVSGDGSINPEFLAITGTYGAGTFMTFGPDPRKNPAAAPVVERFVAAKYDPEGYTLNTYGAIETWAQAVEKAGSFETEAVIKSLRENEFNTVMGKIRFDEKGDFNAPSYVVYKWSDKTYEEYAQ